MSNPSPEIEPHSPQTTDGPQGPFFNSDETAPVGPNLEAVPELPDYTVDQVLPLINPEKFVQTKGSVIRITATQRLRQALHVYHDVTGVEIEPKDRDAQLKKAENQLKGLVSFGGAKYKRQDVADVAEAEQFALEKAREQGEPIAVILEAIEQKVGPELSKLELDELRSNILRVFFWKDIKANLNTQVNIKKKIAPGLGWLLTRILP